MIPSHLVLMNEYKNKSIIISNSDNTRYVEEFWLQLHVSRIYRDIIIIIIIIISIINLRDQFLQFLAARFQGDQKKNCKSQETHLSSLCWQIFIVK